MLYSKKVRGLVNDENNTYLGDDDLPNVFFILLYRKQNLLKGSYQLFYLIYYNVFFTGTRDAAVYRRYK